MLSLSSLSKGEMWVSKPERFNDPHELKLKEIEDSEIELVKGFELLKKQYPKVKDYKKIYREIIKTYQEWVKNYGVSCFSELNNNMLMWAHYANNHHGLCLGFDVGDNPEDLGYYKVNYLNEYPEIDFEQVYHKDGLLKILWSKSKDWEYEKEWRIIMMEGDKSYSYKSELVDVIFGFRTPKDDISFVESILKDKNVNFFQTQINPTKYKIDIIPI
jgi:hypothetical protein